MIEIEVQGIPPSLNVLRNVGHFKWNQMKLDWAYRIHLSARGKRPSKPFKMARCTITYHFQNRRRRDPDNYAGKFVLDPLVELGFIEDDSFDHVILELRQGDVDKEKPRVVIQIEEVAE